MRVDVYIDAAGHYRWRLVARNGRILADSGEGYATRANLMRALRKMATVPGSEFMQAVKDARKLPC